MMMNHSFHAFHLLFLLDCSSLLLKASIVQLILLGVDDKVTISLAFLLFLKKMLSTQNLLLHLIYLRYAESVVIEAQYSSLTLIQLAYSNTHLIADLNQPIIRKHLAYYTLIWQLLDTSLLLEDKIVIRFAHFFQVQEFLPFD